MRRKKYFRKPHRIKKKKPIFKNRFFWLFILTLIIVGSFFYFFVFSAFFQLKDVEITGCRMVPKDRIRNLVWLAVEKKVLFLPTRSIILTDLRSLNKDILRKFPQISGVSLRRNLPDRLRIEVRERLPIGVWCNGEKNCFLVDKEGIIFNPAPSGKPAGLVIRIPESEQRVDLGNKVISREDLELLSKIQKKLEGKKVAVKEFLSVSNAQLRVQTGEGWWIYFNPKGDVDWQITELNLVLEKQILPQKRAALQYIDLRFDKVFVFPEDVLAP